MICAPAPLRSKWLFLRFDDLLYCLQTLFTPQYFLFFSSFSNSQFSPVMFLGAGPIVWPLPAVQLVLIRGLQDPVEDR